MRHAFHRVAIVFLSISIAAVSVSARAAEPADKLPWDDEARLPGPIAALLQDRNYEGAIAALDEVLKKTPPTEELGRALSYAKGRALHLAGKYDDAAVAFEQLEKVDAKGAWARRARFARGVTLARKGDFASAELIYRAEAEYLLSHERKQELADIYLDFAKKYAKPRDEKSPPDQPEPDYGKALEFFGRALALGPKPELRPEIELQMAECHRLSGNNEEAASRYAKFVKDYPDSARQTEARYRLGECQLKLGRTVEARQTWQDIVALWPGDKRPAGDEQFDYLARAAFDIAATHGMPSPGDDDSLELGSAAIEAFLTRFGEHKLAGKAHLSLIQARFTRGRYAEAVAAAERFLSDPKRAAWEEAADIRRLLGFALRQQKKFNEALAAWRDFLVKHPSHASWSEVQQRIIETEYLIGLEAFEKKNYAEARKQWTEFLVRYPLDARSPLIMLHFGRAEYLAEHWEAAINEWRQLVSKYPGHEVASQAQLLIGLTLEEKLGKPTEAMQEYRKLNWGSQASVAQARVARLTAKHLEIGTERIFRTDETPRVRLLSRNIDKVTVRVYTVDLETYFRKMHLARGVESLDLALIDPDQSFEFTVPDYAEFKPCTSQIEVPLPGVDKNPDAPGVVAVTVGSKTMEAVTLVIRSDLDIIIKSSRDEVFAYAQNMRTGKPWKGAKILVSNSDEVFAEGTSGDDGVFRGSYKPLRDAADVRVFAVSAGHTASNLIGLEGVGLGRGLEERGYMYTDRGAYRPGQVVHARGIIRGVADDRFIVVAKKKYRLEAFDPRNRLVHTAEVTTGDFGSFHTFFPLPEEAAPGEYRLQACDIDGRCFQGSFRVENYQLDPVQFTIDSERKVFYRGEDIEGTITAKFYYGTPLVGREVRYTLSDGRTQTAVTDDKGQVKFKFPTREFRESQTLQLTADLPERNLRTAATFILAVQAFSIDATVSRSVVTAGESFELTLTTRTADGEPTGEKLKLHVVEQTVVDGRQGENEVELRDIETDAKTGIGRTTLKIEKGGRYILRAEGRDRFNNPVTARIEVFVSDDADLVRLRILADRHTYKLGEEARVRLVWREAEATALVTYQGAKILGHRLVTLKNGENELLVPMEAYLAPNFTLEVNVMIDVREAADDKAAAGDEADKLAKATKRVRRRFHSAAAPFSVERELTVKIATARRPGATGSIQPGETIDVTVETLDPQGNPVAAEVGLAMIDRANFDRFGSSAGPMNEFFRGATREAAIRTTASIEFFYKPATHTINPRLLTEQERIEIAAQEEELRKSLAAGQPAFDGIPESSVSGLALEYRMSDADDALMFSTAGTGEEFAGRGTVDAGLRYLERFEQLNEESDSRRRLAEVQDAQGQSQAPFVVSVIPVDPYGRMNAPVGGPAAGGMGGAQVATNGAPVSRYSFEFGRDGAKKRDEGRGEMDRLAQAGEALGALADSPASGDFKAQPAKSNAGGVQNFAFVIDGEQNRSVLGANDVSSLRGYFNDNSGRIVVVTDGVQWNLDAKEIADEQRAPALVLRLKESGAVVLQAIEMQETAYWNPAIVTDAAGKAVVSVTLPDRSTAWKLVAKGITVDTLAGEAEGEVIAKKELFGEVALPSVVTDGDTIEAAVTVHDDRPRADDKPAGAIEVTLKTTIGAKSTVETKTIPNGPAAMHELTFPLVIKLPETPEGDDNAAATVDAAELNVTISSGTLSNTVVRVVPIRPFGYPVFAGNGGTATSDTTVWIEQPEGITIERPRLEIVVGAGVDRSLLEVVLGGRAWCGLDARYASPLETTTSDLLAALALQKLLNTTRDRGTAEAAELDARVRSAVGSLTSAQADDGGWTWTGVAGSSDTAASARVLWALSAARGAGYTVPQDTYDKAIAYLTGRQAAVADDDLEGKAIVLHALSEAGHGDFALANRLYRSRASLSPAATSYLALALVKLDHGPMAADLLGIFENRDIDAAGVAGADKVVSPHAGNTEIRALYGLALTRAGVDSPKRKETVDWLMAHRTGSRWTPDRATGPATIVLAEWFAAHRPGGERYNLTVVVNNYEAAKLDIDPDGAAHTIVIDGRHLVAGKQRVQFLMTGRGHLAYQCLLGGFVPADKLKNTGKNWYAQRTFEPALREFDGRELPRGFGVVNGNYTSFRNPLTQLPIGRRGHVELQVYRNYPNGYLSDDKLEYLVVREPLAAGTAVVEQTIRGGFERYELLPGEIVFYVGNRRHIETIVYDVVGVVGGQYRAAPTLIVGAYRPDEMAVTKTTTLTVLPKGRPSADAYRWSPDELYELGKRNFEKRDWPAVRLHLTELLAGWQLDPEPYQDALRMLLDVSLELGPPGDVVKYFELVKEKSPDLEIPFEKILKVGAAYHELGEYERSYLVFRATVESSFVTDSAVAGFLEGQGEFVRSVDVMRRLLREYPPEPYAASAQYALAQGVYAYAPNAAGDPKLRERKLTKLALTAAAERMLDDFLTAYPDDPAADQAAFADANALLDMEQYDRAIARCEASARRYPTSDFLDSYYYIIGYSHFAASRPDAALEMCRKVAEMKRTDKGTGREIASRNRERAIFILGQVYHSLGKAADAIREYTRVADQIPDAKLAIEYFARADIELPEVTTIRPGEPATVKLEFRNVPRCDVKTYRIDLMKFSLLRQNLGAITQINLSGIRPLYETTVELGDGKDYRDRTHELTLPIKDEGAYLVVCRGDNLHTSGFVLVSPLTVDVQEDTANGQVRATVKDVVGDKYAAGVHVKVIGARDGEFKSGETDLRGVFSAEPISGRSTVIAQAGTDRYAFFRGELDLLPPPPTPATTAPSQSEAAEAKPAEQRKQSNKDYLLEELQGGNRMLQQQQIDNLRSNFYYNENKGVKAKAAF